MSSSTSPSTHGTFPSVLSGDFNDYLDNRKISVHLSPECSPEIREHVGYEFPNDPADPRLFEFAADLFLTDALENEWHSIDWSQRYRKILSYEQLPASVRPTLARVHYRIAQSAVLPASGLWQLIMSVLGCHAGWELRCIGAQGNITATFSAEFFRQHDNVSLSAFLRSVGQTGLEMRFDIFMSDNSVRTASYGPMLPWILELYRRAQRGGSRGPQQQPDTDYTEMSTGGLGDFGSFKPASQRTRFAPSCALDPTGRIWDQAHLVPQTLSPHTFATAIAAVWRSLAHANDQTPLAGQALAMFTQAKALMETVPLAATPQELSNALHALSLPSTRENNMLPLGPLHHRLLDAEELYVCPFSRMPVWVGQQEMPPSFLTILVGGFVHAPLRAHLQRPKRLLPATSANACCTIFHLMGDPAFQNRLKNRAARVIMCRRVGPVRGVQVGKHPREDPDGDDDKGGSDAKQRRTGRYPGPTAEAAQSPTAGDDQPPAGRASGSGPGDSKDAGTAWSSGPQDTKFPPSLPRWSSKPPISVSSASSEAGSSAKWAYGPAPSTTASTAATSASSGAQTVKRRRLSPAAEDYSTGTGTGKAVAAATAEAAAAAAAAAAPVVDQGRLSPVVQQSAAGTGSRGASPGEESQRGARSRTPSADGDALNSWWVKTGGSDEERDLRLAVVQLDTLACSFRYLREEALLPAQVFTHVFTEVKRLLEKAAGTWQPDRSIGETAEDYDDDETDPEVQNVRAHKLTPRIRKILGLDAQGKVTEDALLDAESYAQLSRCLQRATFFTWWPVTLVGEAAGLRLSETPVVGAG